MCKKSSQLPGGKPMAGSILIHKYVTIWRKVCLVAELILVIRWLIWGLERKIKCLLDQGY
jgi:hypothetical protein